MSRHGPENNDWRCDYNDGTVPPSTHETHPLIHQVIIIQEVVVVMRNYNSNLSFIINYNYNNNINNE